MNKRNLIIDVALCNNCNNCVLATKDEYVGNNFPGYSAPQSVEGASVIRIERTVRGASPMVDSVYVPVMCQHCDDAPCIKATGGDGSIRKRDDGVVIVDPVKAKGRRDLVGACPYGAIVWNEQEQLPQNWIFDAHLLDQGWKQPRCVQACPTLAITAVNDETLTTRRKAEALEELRPELNSKPRVLYKNLYRYNRCFIGGSVAATSGDEINCVADAAVTLLQNGNTIATLKTDAFGDFKFDRLSPQSGQYTVEVSHPQFGKAQLNATLDGSSVVLGEIRLG